MVTYPYSLSKNKGNLLFESLLQIKVNNKNKIKINILLAG